LIRKGRGWLWVIAQTILVVGVVASWSFPPRVHVTALHWVGLALALSGAALFMWAYRTLGDSFTIFPQPKAEAELATDGPFALVRHPMYLAGVLFFAGCSLGFAWWGLAATGVLALFWVFKARREERHLSERFPSYGEYRERVRRQFIPFVY
jgi:protein-S-isoprenylcysteine O-methyltransferase Ste14